MVKIMRLVLVALGSTAIGLGAATHAAAAEPAGQPAAASPGATAIEKAAKDNKYLFIFFWREDTQPSRVMRGGFQAAMAKMADKAQTVEIQVADAAEAAIVARYNVSRAPMPLILAIGPNGAVTKALATRCDEDQLRQAFVSPCTAACMKGLQDRKLVLLCVRKAAPPGQTLALPKTCRSLPPMRSMRRPRRLLLSTWAMRPRRSSSRAFKSIRRRSRR